MKEHPLLFSSPMVRALLDGSKTQTRRVCKPMQSWVDQACREVRNIDGAPFHFLKCAEEPLERLRCPYGQPGDRIWVRETWRTDASLDAKPPRDFSGWPVKYEADGTALRHGAHFGKTDGKTRVSIHMPRWASRILLEIVSVRVERLNDCSDADARAEGTPGGHGVIPSYNYNATPSEHYSHLWESLNGSGSWAANPWVWVIEFKRITA